MAEHVTIAGPAGALDARLHGASLGTGGGPSVLLLHPHPAFGGSMGSRLVYDLAKGLAAAGWQALRFSFRGVGRSAGKYDGGPGEVADAEAAWHWLHDRTGRAPIVVGHSFGGGVATRLAGRVPAAALAIIGTPATVRESDLTPGIDAAAVTCPAHVILGDQDEVVDVASARRVAGAFAAPGGATLTVLTGAGHFLEPSHNPRVLAALEPWLQRVLADGEA